MKFTGKNFHGGDVQGYGIDRLPEGLVEVTGVQERILARGEVSGHCHIINGPDVKIFKDPKTGNMFAAVGGDGAHHAHYKEAMLTPATFAKVGNISNADHTKECFLPPGNYALGLDRQYDPHEAVWKKNTD